MPTVTLPKLEREIIPIGDTVLVYPKHEETVTPSGIITKTDAATKIPPQRGVVLAMGPGKPGSKKPSDVFAVGDEVLIQSVYSGYAVKFKTTDGQSVELKLLPLKEISGKVTDC